MTLRRACIAVTAGTALLLCLAPAWAAPGTEPAWQVLSLPDKGFSVEMPAAPEHRDNLRDPELFASVDDYGAAMGAGFAMVSVFAFVPEKRDLLADAEIFELGEAMVPAGCAVTASHRLSGGPGGVVEADFACQNGIGLRYRMHISGDRLYRLAAGGPEGVAEGDAADRFFRSFALVD